MRIKDVDNLTASDLAKYIDHTLLAPEASRQDVKKMCDEAKEYGFASVAVYPSYARYVAEQLSGSDSKACAVVGFSSGAFTPEIKAFETNDVIMNGAREVDMVINVGAIKNNDWELVKRDIEAVVQAADGRALVKVILETGLLTDEEKVKACTVSQLAGADFVKTATGLHGGATVQDVKLMRKTVGDNMGVKASGGIRNFEDAKAMIAAGANRLGTSAGIAIVTGK